MRSAPPALVSIVLILGQILAGCSSTNPAHDRSNSAAQNVANTSIVPAKDNIEEFADLVQLPFEPDEVAWNDDGGKSLTAVVRFSAENASKMADELATFGPPMPATVAVESWFPAELIALSDLSGESVVKGQSFPAGAFLKPPYTGGKITRVDGTDYFILQISS